MIAISVAVRAPTTCPREASASAEMKAARGGVRNGHFVEQCSQRTQSFAVGGVDSDEGACTGFYRLVQVFFGDSTGIVEDPRDLQVGDLLHMRQQIVDGFLLLQDQLNLTQAATVNTGLVEAEHRVWDVVDLIFEHDGVSLFDVVLDEPCFAVVILVDRYPLKGVTYLLGVALLILIHQPFWISVGLNVLHQVSFVQT